MAILNIKFMYKEYDVEVDFHSKVNILTGDAGSGKSYLLRMLDSYLYANGIPYCKVG